MVETCHITKWVGNVMVTEWLNSADDARAVWSLPGVKYHMAIFPLS